MVGNFKNILYAIISLFIFGGIPAKSQIFTVNRGIPFIRNFTENEYSAHEQNFDIIQDSLGVMYFANFEAVLIYNGADWKKIPMKSGMRVLSLDIDKKGRVYVGGLYDFGYIQKDNYGNYSYVSLADTTKPAEYTGEVFSVNTLDNQVFFVTKNRMFIYEDTAVKVVDFQNTATEAYKAGGNFFLFFKRDFNKPDLLQNGLVIYENGKFTKIIDNSSAQIVDIRSVFYFPEKHFFVLGTGNQGFFQMKNNEITDFDAPVNDFLRSNSNTCGVVVDSNLYALGTLTKGILFVDKAGNSLQLVNDHSGLCDNTINAIFLDKEKNLWVATNNGLALVEINNAVSVIPNKISGISGKINKIFQFDNKIFVAAENGLFADNFDKFQRIDNFSNACWDALIVSKKVFLATTFGVYFYQNGKMFSTDIDEFTYSLAISNDLLFAGQNSKISILKISEDKYTIIDTIRGLTGNVNKLLVVGNKLYAEVPPGKIYEININTLKIRRLVTGEKFISLHLNVINNKVFFSSEKGLFTVSQDVDTVVPFVLSSENKKFSKLWIYDLFHLSENLYIITDGSRKNLRFLTLNNNDYSIDAKDFMPVSIFTARCFYYLKNDKKVWIGGNDGVIVYDLSKKYEHKPKRKVFFTRISAINSGNLFDLCNCSSDRDVEIQRIKFADNSLLFRYTASYFPARSEIKYRYFLEGFDKDTSDWTSLNYRELTNLPSGNYAFCVQAKDQFGNLIDGEKFEFKILVPVARRWWAIAIYVLIIGILVKLIIDWRLRIAEKEKQRLEEIIKERTEEIERSKAEIEAQRDIEYAQRKEIMDSIYYARRIQQAVLPARAIFKDVFGENFFVFFRPYNVVSGDFFWIKKIKNYVAVVAADCTGHGVPGAFMSMLGTSFLNEIVTRRSLDSAAEILERLRKKVKTSLHQEGKKDEQKDGMDISLYLLDTESLTLQFAGAYNPLYIVRHNSKISKELLDEVEQNKKIKVFRDESSDANYTLFELKADRQPIGIYLREKSFNNVNFQLQQGDCLYNFSDGYQDQFGGDTGEKFNSKRFRKLFLSIQEMPMNEQIKIIEQNFLKWKADVQQIDDVLVLGVKIDL